MSDLVKRLRGMNLTVCGERPCDEAANRIEQLEAELAECKLDAERYRWLRRTCVFGLSGSPSWGGVIRFQLVEQKSRNMDEAIDAAMMEQQHDE